MARRKNIPYPEARTDYSDKVAKVGELTYRIGVIELGLDIKPHLIQNHGADLEVEDCSIGGEVWNWSYPHCYKDREDSVISNLQPFDTKLLITSFISDEVSHRMEVTYNDKPIEIIELGFQILPNEYYQWAVSNKITYGVKFNNKRTMKYVRNRLLSNPSIRNAIASAKAKEKLSLQNKDVLENTQSTEKKKSKDNSCYVYSTIPLKPLESDLSNSSIVHFEIRCKMGLLSLKCRLKSCLLELKSSVKAILPKCHFASKIKHCIG